jgi:hypothetical protein
LQTQKGAVHYEEKKRFEQEIATFPCPALYKIGPKVMDKDILRRWIVGFFRNAGTKMSEMVFYRQWSASRLTIRPESGALFWGRFSAILPRVPVGIRQKEGAGGR